MSRPPVLNRMLPHIGRALAAIGYDRTHVTRVMAYRAIDAVFDAMPCATLDTLEISAGWKWRTRAWGSFTEMNWPQHDICGAPLDRKFDVVIADNVWEHLRYPLRAARHVRAMLRPGACFVNITPFLIRQHAVPIDCTRWTELGMLHLLEEAGFDATRIATGSWGNRAAVRANFGQWARAGWRRDWPNEPDFPLTVWAVARA